MSGTLTPALMGDESTKSSDLSGTEARVIESQPMTVSNSNSSNHSLKDGSSNAMASAAPYGTRSRNRTGNPRPNYAEDKELDAEFEIASAKDVPDQMVTSLVDPFVSQLAPQASGIRKAAASESDAVLVTQSHSQDPIPGTSAFSATLVASSSSQVSKKRKATSNPTATPLHSLPHVIANNATMGQTAERKGSTAQVVPGFRETNMLGFDISGGRLKKKKLVADDGTTLEVNGEFLFCNRRP